MAVADEAVTDSDQTVLDDVPNAERLVAQAVEKAGDDHTTASLVGRFWRFAPDEELVGYTPEEMFAAAADHRELARNRLPGELKLAVTEPPGPQAHSVLRIVTDDMPFLVDSVIALLNAHNLQVYLTVHPLIVVRREPLGALAQLESDVEPDDAIEGDLVESWIRIEIDPVRRPEAREQLLNEVRRVLTDVRDAVEDWPRMRQRAVVIADELAASRGSEQGLPVPDKDVTDSIELLKWLADDHFTFLGYREYRLDDGVLTAVPGSGLGILRGASKPRRLAAEMAPEVYERAMERRLLVITKANSRATVHRSAYLDYISVKMFDEAGHVAGERRFLGLFSSSAYRTSVRELPVVKRKVQEVMDRSGLSPRGHSGKDLLQILETYPRDELFQIKTDDLYEAVIGVLRMAGRRQLRLFLRRDGYGRFISCLIYLPRDRFTTGNRLRMQEILLRELNGIGVDYTTRVTERMLARVHFIVRTDPAAPPGNLEPNELAEK
ncbi:NAD-glutamate dehydrogenase, partial [Actinoplanes utahensis]